MNHSPIARIVADVRSGTTTARSLAEDAICSYEASDLGAYIVFDAEGARRRADAVDAAVARSEDPGPLAGVTVSVKDLYGVEGLPIRAGTRRELPDRWQREGFLVRSLRRLGAVIVGKTHTVELAFGGIGLNPNTGTPLNPWDPAEHRAPGGSSSGAGVSLWERSAMLAVGSDTGGSVRIPASATGVVGMRHTTGRWPTDGVVPLSTTFDTVGFLTHTVEDTRHVFQAIDPLAPGGGSPDTAPDPDRDALAGLRIGIPRDGIWQEAQPDIDTVLRRALTELEAAGAQVIEIDAPELQEAGERYMAGGLLIPPERTESLERHLPGWTAILDPTVGKRLERAHQVSAVEYIGLLRLRRRLSASLHARLDEQHIDLLATPTLSIIQMSEHNRQEAIWV
ncbi:MAG: amidase, partial [Gemmatimonadetes bacterium]|nr:amidase [Gemmatimonadota bacterium]